MLPLSFAWDRSRSFPKGADVTQFLLWFLGVPAALGAAMLLAYAAEWIVWQVGNVSGRCHVRLTGWRAEATQKSVLEGDRQAFLDWVAARTGGEQLTGTVDDRLIQAQRQ